MYEYTFRKIKSGFKSGELKEDYQEVVRDFAGRGWRLVQVFSPPGTGQDRSPVYFELIFEREIQELSPDNGADPSEKEPLLYSLDVQTDDQSIFKLDSDINLQDLITAVTKLKEDGLLKQQDIQDLVQEIKNLDLMKRMYGIKREDYLKDLRTIAEKIQKLIADKNGSSRSQ